LEECRRYLDWLLERIDKTSDTKGFIALNKNKPSSQLKYSKKEAAILCKMMYYAEDVPQLVRYGKKRREDKESTGYH